MPLTRFDKDPGAPLSKRQEQELSAFFKGKRRPISLIVFEDGQSPTLLLDYIVQLRSADRARQDTQAVAGALYNLAANSSNPVGLIEKLQGSSVGTSIVVLHADSSFVTDGFIDLIAYLCQERFETGPEVVLLFDRIDLQCTKQPILDCFSGNDILDLTFWNRNDKEDEMEEVLMKHMNLPGFPW